MYVQFIPCIQGVCSLTKIDLSDAFWDSMKVFRLLVTRNPQRRIKKHVKYVTKTFLRK